ncbi:hypothetical protein A2U01_0113282, partial [Trifolium medium]|nr:hypothetical protein [Trifolium medium]
MTEAEIHITGGPTMIPPPPKPPEPRTWVHQRQ